MKGVDSRKASKRVTLENKRLRIEKLAKAPIKKPIKEEIYEAIRSKPINFNGLVILNSFMEYLLDHESLTEIQLDLFKKLPILYQDKNRIAVEDSYVYLMYTHTDEKQRVIVKIGYSKNPKQRVGELKTGNPKVKLIAFARGSRITESKLHRYFANMRTAGEWFAFPMTKEEAIREFEKAVKEVATDSPLKAYRDMLLDRWKEVPKYLNTNMKPL